MNDSRFWEFFSHVRISSREISREKFLSKSREPSNASKEDIGTFPLSIPQIKFLTIFMWNVNNDFVAA